MRSGAGPAANIVWRAAKIPAIALTLAVLAVPEATRALRRACRLTRRREPEEIQRVIDTY